MIILILLFRHFQCTFTENRTDDFNLNRQRPVLRRVFPRSVSNHWLPWHGSNFNFDIELESLKSKYISKPAGLYGELSIIEKLLANYDRRVRKVLLW